MRIILLFITTLICCCVAAQSTPPLIQEHRPGEVSYTLVSTVDQNGAPYDYYHFTFKIVVECDYPKPEFLPFFINDFDQPAGQTQYEWIFDSASNKVDVVDPCIAFSYSPCYRIFYFHQDVPLQFNRGGYSLFFPDCCRNGYNNIRTTNYNVSTIVGKDLHLTWGAPDTERPSIGYAYNGILYVVNIPSRFKVLRNSSPTFNNSTDTILYVCNNDTFSHSFSAFDVDGDSLVYGFSSAQMFFVKIAPLDMAAIQTNGSALGIVYAEPGYNETQPLGEGVSIDSKTGLMHGRLHDTGSYLATVSVWEYRNGQRVSTTPHTRDVVIKVFDCGTLPVPQAMVAPLMNTCDTKTITLQNYSTPYHPELYWDNNKYLWDLGDGDTSHRRYPTHTYDTGTYNVRLITMAGYRCADTAYTKLLVYPTLRPSFVIKGNGCTDQPVKFVNTSSTGIGLVSNLSWTFTNLKDSSSFTSTLSTPTYTFRTPNQTYAAILDVTTNKGCEAKDTQLINIWQSPFPLNTHDTIITSGAPYALYPNSGYDTTNSSYIWSPAAGLDDPYAGNPVATGTQDITYHVQMSNAFGCSLADTVHIRYYKGPDIYVPAAFTPNGDGMNDVFRPFTVGIKKLAFFRVFNRWGGLMYQTETYMAGWDGNKNGRQAAAGTYIWEARGTDYNNKTVFKKGTVLLIR